MTPVDEMCELRLKMICDVQEHVKYVCNNYNQTYTHYYVAVDYYFPNKRENKTANCFEVCDSNFNNLKIFIFHCNKCMRVSFVRQRSMCVTCEINLAHECLLATKIQRKKLVKLFAR